MSRRNRRNPSRRDVFVDSSGWLALLHARDRRHADADAAIRSALAATIPLFTTNLVLSEVHRLLLHRVGMSAARLFLARVDTSPEVEVVFAGREHHCAASKWLDKLSDQVITYTDAVSFAAMEERGCTSVIGFDRHFAIAGFQPFRP